jgi:formate C-acetyltransferase
MAGLKHLLDINFEGNEDLRQILLNKAPKYGNDIDDVDSIARQIGSLFCHQFEKCKDLIGGQWQAGLWSAAENVSCGVVVGATPDGRRAGEMLADNISPVQGRDLKGLTAAARSVAKIDHVMASDGTAFHMKLHPATLEGEKGLKNLASFTRGFFELGGMNCQVNALSAETLRNAQKKPEKYRNLVVRVAGFSAFFTHLDQKTQEDIIKRTEHGRRA